MPVSVGRFFPAKNITDKIQREITVRISTGGKRGAAGGPPCQWQNKSKGGNTTFISEESGVLASGKLLMTLSRPLPVFFL